MTLRLEELAKSFGPIAAVAGVSLELGEESPLALLGPSGCGKSTLLRLVAGLERPDRGRVLLDGRDVTGWPPQRRGVGMVFQDFALFPHLDVAGNVSFSLRERGRAEPEIRRRTSELLDLVGLAGFEPRRTFELSGGQQQRVALARALASEPALLLLDEPLSNLDPELRATLQGELRELLSGIEVKALYVTHDQVEAFSVAPRIAVMRSGRIVQQASGEELLARPRDPWVARFLGYRNLLPAERLLGGNRAGGTILVRDDLIRPSGPLVSRVEHLERLGHRLRLDLAVPAWGASLSWEGFRRELPHDLRVGDELGLDVPDGALLELEESR